MNDKSFNDEEYMKQILISSNDGAKRLGKKLSKNPEFIIEVVKDKNFHNYWALLKSVDESLMNTDFVLTYIKAVYDKGEMSANGYAKMYEIVPKTLIYENEGFWEEMIKLGLTDHERFGTSQEATDKRIELRKNEIKNLIDTITVDKFNEMTRGECLSCRNDSKFMLEVISKNPSLYVCAAKVLKEDEKFSQLLISQVPGIEPLINLEKQKIQDEYKEKEEKIKNKKIEEKKQKEEDKKKLELLEQKKIKQEYEEQGELHPNLILVNEFIKSNTSKILFSKIHNISIEQLNEIIKEVSFVYPEIVPELVEKSKQASAIHLTTVESINSALLSGKMTFEQYSRENYKGKRINDLLNGIKDSDTRKQFNTLLVNSIASGQLTMMDYMRLFSDKYEYKTIVNGLNKYMKTATREVPELQGKDKPIYNAMSEIKSLKKYSNPFLSKDFVGSSRGVINLEGKNVMVTITEEYIEYAKEYLKSKDEYICYTTMNATLSKLVKGEITFSDIEKTTTKHISMKSVVANALTKGITTEQVKKVTTLENTLEGVRRYDE